MKIINLPRKSLILLLQQNAPATLLYRTSLLMIGNPKAPSTCHISLVNSTPVMLLPNRLVGYFITDMPVDSWATLRASASSQKMIICNPRIPDQGRVLQDLMPPKTVTLTLTYVTFRVPLFRVQYRSSFSKIE